MNYLMKALYSGTKLILVGDENQLPSVGPGNVLKDIIDKISNDLEKGVIFFANIIDQSKIIYIAKNKNTNANCGFLVKEAAIKSGGNGGGRADFAQSGGKDVIKVDEVLDFIREQLQ